MSSSPATAERFADEPQDSMTSPAAGFVSEEVVISVQDVGKCYEIYGKPLDRLKQTIYRGRRQFYREFWALRHTNLDVRRGEAVGIIGRNGSGKSTLLQLIAGTLRPTEGRIRVQGRVHALLELGSGFNPDFTGRENVFLNGAILGLSRRHVEERFDSIAGFADIGQFIDQPVKTYSTGMVVRLAFSVQVQLDPDVLIVDEALAVGDSLFQKRCYQRIEELRAKGVTLLFVSHDQESVRTLTTRALLLESGETVSVGSSAEVVLEYRKLLHEMDRRYYEALTTTKQAQSAPTTASAEAPKRSDSFSFGDLDAEVGKVELLDGDRQSVSVFHPGEPVVIRIHIGIHRDLTHLNVGIRLRNKEGMKLYSWGTFNQDVEMWNSGRSGESFWEQRFEKGTTAVVELEFECCLGQNFYEVQAYVATEQTRHYGTQRMLHWRDEAAFFNVNVMADRHFFGGICDLRAQARLHEVCQGPIPETPSAGS